MKPSNNLKGKFSLKRKEGLFVMPKKRRKDRIWTDEEWRQAVERSIALIREAQEKAKTMSYDEFAKWWDEHGAVKGGGAYEALLEMREAMRGWDSKPKRKSKSKKTGSS